jgi:hypothetical protein
MSWMVVWANSDIRNSGSRGITFVLERRGFRHRARTHAEPHGPALHVDDGVVPVFRVGVAGRPTTYLALTCRLTCSKVNAEMSLQAVKDLASATVCVRIQPE